MRYRECLAHAMEVFLHVNRKRILLRIRIRVVRESHVKQHASEAARMALSEGGVRRSLSGRYRRRRHFLASRGAPRSSPRFAKLTSTRGSGRTRDTKKRSRAGFGQRGFEADAMRASFGGIARRTPHSEQVD